MDSVTEITSIVEGIRQIKQLCTVEDEISRPFNLTPREMSGLLALRPRERVGCYELAERMGLSASRGSRIIASLIEKGYLLRGESDEDRRCIRVSLSSRGERCRRKVLESETACERRLLSRLTGDQARQVEEGIRILLTVLQQEDVWVK